MASPWKTMPQHVPTDGVEVWVRLGIGLSAPFRATWSESSQAFTNASVWDSVNEQWVDTGLILPWFSLMNWKEI